LSGSLERLRARDTQADADAAAGQKDPRDALGDDRLADRLTGGAAAELSREGREDVGPWRRATGETEDVDDPI
jgi:hypothetical protein